MSNRYESILAKHEQGKSSLSTAARANRYEEILKSHAASRGVSDENSGVSENVRVGRTNPSSEGNDHVDSLANRAAKLQLDDDSSDDEATTPLLRPFVRASSGKRT